MQIQLRIGRIRNAHVWPNIDISTRNNKGKYGAHAQTAEAERVKNNKRGGVPEKISKKRSERS